MSRTLLALSLLAGLAVTPAAGQGRASSGAGAILRSPGPSGPGRATTRIFTLAWQEITIPGDLARPAGHTDVPPRRFVLSWEPLEPAFGPREVAARGPCTVMRLVLVPCE